MKIRLIALALALALAAVPTLAQEDKYLDHPLSDYNWVIRHQSGIDQEIADWYLRVTGASEIAVATVEHINWRAGPEFIRWEREYGAPLTLRKLLEGQWPSAPPPPPPSTKRFGLVRQVGDHAIEDDDGRFVAIGATFFSAVYLERHDPQRLEEELTFIKSAGRGAVDYLRILGALGGDCDDYWREIRINPTDSEYREFLGRTIDRIYDRHGMRVALSIFGGDCWDHPRRLTIDDVLAVIASRVDKVIYLEVSNEAWQTEYEGDFDALIADTNYLVARTPHLVASSSAFGAECEGPEGWQAYAGQGATLFTEHYDREINLSEGPWRPVRQPWEFLFCEGIPGVATNDEPIGPGSSVESDDDPWRLVSAAAVSFIANHSFYTFHSTAGVRNDTRFSELPRIRETLAGFAALKTYVPASIVAWDEQNHHWDGHPFEVVRIWPDEGPPGAVRAYAVTSGDQFKVLPMGINGSVSLRAKQDMTIELIDPLTATLIQRQDLDRGETLVVSDNWPAIWVSGVWR